MAKTAAMMARGRTVQFKVHDSTSESASAIAKSCITSGGNCKKRDSPGFHEEKSTPFFCAKIESEGTSYLIDQSSSKTLREKQTVSNNDVGAILETRTLPLQPTQAFTKDVLPQTLGSVRKHGLDGCQRAKSFHSSSQLPLPPPPPPPPRRRISRGAGQQKLKTGSSAALKPTHRTKSCRSQWVFRCPACDAIFTHFILLSIHTWSHAPAGLELPPITREPLPSSFDPVPPRCFVCTLKFTSKKALSAHITRDHCSGDIANSSRSNGAFECPFCAVRFMTSLELINHIEIGSHPWRDGDFYPVYSGVLRNHVRSLHQSELEQLIADFSSLECCGGTNNEHDQKRAERQGKDSLYPTTDRVSTIDASIENVYDECVGAHRVLASTEETSIFRDITNHCCAAGTDPSVTPNFSRVRDNVEGANGGRRLSFYDPSTAVTPLVKSTSDTISKASLGMPRASSARLSSNSNKSFGSSGNDTVNNQENFNSAAHHSERQSTYTPIAPAAAAACTKHCSINDVDSRVSSVETATATTSAAGECQKMPAVSDAPFARKSALRKSAVRPLIYNYQCAKCKMRFVHGSQLKAHIDMRHRSSSMLPTGSLFSQLLPKPAHHSCVYCSARFKSLAGLRTHLDCDHFVKTTPSRICSLPASCDAAHFGELLLLQKPAKIALNFD